MSEKVDLTFDEALAMLPEGDTIHTFRSAPGIVLGVDMSREEILEKLRTYTPQLSGEMAARMRHALVLVDADGPLFIETQE